MSITLEKGTREDVERLLPHRGPALLVTSYEIIVPGERAIARVRLAHNSRHFRGHFPGCPVLPGVVALEMAAQVCGLVVAATLEEHGTTEGVSGRFVGLDKIRFRNAAGPGDTLRFSVEHVSALKGVYIFSCITQILRGHGEIPYLREFPIQILVR